MRPVSSFRFLRERLFTSLNFVDRIIFSMSSSNFFNSWIGGGFLVNLKPHVSLEEVVVPGLRKK